MFLFKLKTAGFIPVAGLMMTPALRAPAQATNGVPPDKSDYNLFNPVPENLMRDSSPDRPDQTESACTVHTGHYRLEMDFANFTYDESDGTTTKARDVGDFNLKAGLLNNVDVQLIYDSYLKMQTQDSSGNSTAQSGFGDLTTRLKVNLWGDDGGKTAFALLPDVTFPTGTDNLGNSAVEGGMIFPLAVSRPHDFGLSLEAAASYMKNHNDGGYDEEFIASASVDHQIFGKVRGFVEFFSNLTTESHTDWMGTVDTGLEYLMTRNIQLDYDCYFGVRPAAPDFDPFAGIIVRS